MKASILVALVGCTSTYGYRFEVPAPTVDATLAADIHVVDDAIEVALTNKTDEVLQVDWSKIAVHRGDGTSTLLRPTTDLGWIPPNATATVRLVPFTLPRTGDAAARYEGRELELAVPVIARKEPQTYRFHFTAHVHSI